MSKNKLPLDWQIKKLGEVCKLKNGYAFKSDNYLDKGIPVIRISDIKDGLIVPRNTVHVSENSIYDSYVINENEIIVAMSGATTGKFGIYKSKDKAYQNQRVGKFDIIDKAILDNNFLLHQLHSLKRQIEKDAYGGAQPNISSKKIEEMEIVLPPLQTQQAIVSKIEELFSELDQGIEDLKTAQQQLKTYRQSVLKWAFEGKLTNENVREGELPEGWKIVKLSDIGRIVSGGTPSTNNPLYWNGNINWIAPSDLTGYKAMLIKSGKKSISELGLKKSSARLMPRGSILFSSRAPIGYVVIADSELCTNQGFKSIIPNSNVENVFVYYFLKSSKQEAEKVASGTTFKEISLKSFSELSFPLPQLEEQNRIVQEIESRLSVADKMEESIAQSLQQAEALRQSILKKAFSGELV